MVNHPDDGIVGAHMAVLCHLDRLSQVSQRGLSGLQPGQIRWSDGRLDQAQSNLDRRIGWGVAVDIAHDIGNHLTQAAGVASHRHRGQGTLLDVQADGRAKVPAHGDLFLVASLEARQTLVGRDRLLLGGGLIFGMQANPSGNHFSARVQGMQVVHPVSHQSSQIDRQGRVDPPALIQTCKREQIRDQDRHPGRRVLDVLDGLVGTLQSPWIVALHPVELCIAVDGGQRGTKLMAGIRNKLFHLFGGLALLVEGMLDSRQHGIQGCCQGTHLGILREAGNALG